MSYATKHMKVLLLAFTEELLQSIMYMMHFLTFCHVLV